MKVIINERERGLLYKNGKLTKLLMPGKYHFGANSSVEKLPVNQYIENPACTFEALMSLEGAREALVPLEVADNEYCLHYIDGNFMSILGRGRYAFWKAQGKHEFKKIDREEPEITDQVTAFELTRMPVSLYRVINVGNYQKARLYYDNKLVRMLDPGKYLFWTGKTNVTAELEDMRERQLDINGQEILTADKVGLRINFVMVYKVTDAEKIATVAENITSYLYTAAQLVLREYVSKYKTDEILENRDKISDEVINVLRERTKNAYIEIVSAGIKDIILPGEISAIMNSVLAAEKRAQANVITRREEVASTRSLLNTAKLLDENETLRRLKELEYLERICEHVGEINVSGGGDVLSRLTELLGNGNKDK
ncbi:MAG: slipin family protein [Ruminococcaceae bacterium]|nr:slipin family protein [Oscillospiraceae bacterium]